MGLLINASFVLQIRNRIRNIVRLFEVFVYTNTI